MTRDYKQEWADRKAKIAQAAPELTAEQLENKELRSSLRRTQAALAKKTAKVEDLVDAVYLAAKDAAIALGPAEPVPAPKKYTGKVKPEMALLCTFDWQLGKKTNTYGLDVAVDRVNELCTKAARLVDIQRADHPVNEGHVLLGGDTVENVNIFPGQAYEIEAHLFEQMFAGAQLIEDMLRRQLAVFPVVHVYEEYGNHGRIGRRGEMPKGDNVDRMIYRIVRDRFASEKRITFHPHDSWYQIIELGNYRALFIHGDEIFSFGQTPLFAALRKGIAWSSGVVEPFKDIYMGHYHTPFTLVMANGGRIFGTGSIESGNEYARGQIGALGLPSQRLHFVEPSKGRVTSEHTIWLS